ncbi:MAG: hypothetical protein A2Y15_05915 [Clostridiales bacterium GWF2_36_10]|nr:MAG: hypothetical protein A2Y15_05915 [Clostridiales bacterium GWF2_36_10]HAN21607.1 hypothetical protein [Clostridiales bacterium]
MISTLDRNIESAKELKLGGCLRSAVYKRLNHAVTNKEEFTDKQFEYWMSCFKDAATMVDDVTVESGIYRDLGWLLGSYGDNVRALQYYKKAVETNPKTPFLQFINDEINRLEK